MNPLNLFTRLETKIKKFWDAINLQISENTNIKIDMLHV